MWILKLTGQFKRDLKRYKLDNIKIRELKVVLKQLQDTGKVDQKYKPHTLSGKYKGYLECHIKNDFLLIWLDESNNAIVLVRLGSHSELFKK